MNCRENAEATRNELEELRDLTKWMDSFESSTEWNMLVSAKKSHSAKGRTKPGELQSLRDLPKSPPARHVWILEEVTHKSAEKANQQVNIHPVEDSEDRRVNGDGAALELGVHGEEVVVKMVMVKSAEVEGNLEEDAQPPFPTVRDSKTGSLMNREEDQLLDLVHLDRYGALVHTTPGIAISKKGDNRTHREPDGAVDPVLHDSADSNVYDTSSAVHEERGDWPQPSIEGTFNTTAKSIDDSRNPGILPRIETFTADEVAREQHGTTPVGYFVEDYPLIHCRCDVSKHRGSRSNIGGRGKKPWLWNVTWGL